MLCRSVFIVIWMVLSIVVASARAADRPNIIFIFSDDQCYETVNALWDTEVQTPNLDALAAEGVSFRFAYNQGAWHDAVCVASRTMLNTGRFLWRAQQIDNRELLEAEREAGRFWSQYMKKAGYDTYFTGKWHIQADAEKAFDYVRHVRPGMPNQTKEGYNRPIEGKPDLWSPYDAGFEGFWKGGKHWSEVLGDDAVDFIAQAAKRDKPFFMYLAFNAPHDPRQSPKEYVDKYPLEKVRAPVNFLPQYPYKDQIGCSKELRDEALAPFPRTQYAVKVNRQEYFAIITHMDEQIGRILDAIEQSGKVDNTWVFFTADHGLAAGRHGLMGKQNLYDHSVRVPFIVRGPGAPRGGTNDARIYLQDVMPTTLELAGAGKPEHVQFKSLLPLIHGETETPYDAIYGAYMDMQRSVVLEGYKLILYPKASKMRLYDLKTDPLELNDLADDAKSKPIIRKLFKRLLALQAETDDMLDLRKTFGNP